MFPSVIYSQIMTIHEVRKNIVKNSHLLFNSSRNVRANDAYSFQAEGDLYRLEDGAPWTSKEKCSGSRRVAHNSGMILEPQEPLQVGASSVSDGRITIIHLSGVLIENRSMEQFVLGILLFIQHGEEFFEP